MIDNRNVEVIRLTEIIENVKQAVDDSSFGPIMIKQTNPDDISDSKNVVSPVAFQIFTLLLQSKLMKDNN